MKFRCVAAVMLVFGLNFTSGCDEFLLGLDLDSLLDYESYAPLPDGMYEGNVTGSAEMYYGGSLYDEYTDSSLSTARFMNGEIVTDNGSMLDIGDIDEADFGGIIMTREVYDITHGDGWYTVEFDVWAEWGDGMLTGVEYITFSENADGSLAMFDSLELTSQDGFWSLHANASGRLGAAQSPTIPPRDILDEKSGKPKH